MTYYFTHQMRTDDEMSYQKEMRTQEDTVMMR